MGRGRFAGAGVWRASPMEPSQRWGDGKGGWIPAFSGMTVKGLPPCPRALFRRILVP